MRLTEAKETETGAFPQMSSVFDYFKKKIIYKKINDDKVRM